MHKIEKTPKILTIIGLVLEGIAAVSSAFFAYLFSMMDSIPGLKVELLKEMTIEEYDELLIIFDFVVVVLLVFAIIITAIFMINLVLFSKLIKGSFTDEQAKKVYLYQAIWGGISIILNTVTGILYLISGVQGYSEETDNEDFRDGI